MRQAVPVPTHSWAPEWKPYTIIGDDQWSDYEISADVYLNPGTRRWRTGARVHSTGPLQAVKA